MNESDLITLAQLASHLRVPASWLRAEADAGRLPHVRAGHQRLFNLPSVLSLLADRAARERGGGP
jgi:hypothetical protein